MPMGGIGGGGIGRPRPMGPAQPTQNAFEALRQRGMPQPAQQMRPAPSMPMPGMQDPMQMTAQGMAGGGTMAGPQSGFGFDYLMQPRRR